MKMAKRRMFSLDVVDTDLFLDMPVSAQNLYFHLGMRADDDGFVDNPKKIMKIVNSSDDDMKLLFAKKFVIPFENGVCVIRHWRIHNYIRGDRYTPTVYENEKERLRVSENGLYTEKDRLADQASTDCQPLGIPDDNQKMTQVRLGKDRLGKVSINTPYIPHEGDGENPSQTDAGEKTEQVSFFAVEEQQKKRAAKQTRFVPPTVDEVRTYCQQRNNDIDPQYFVDSNDAKGWVTGKNNTPIKNWKAVVNTWESFRRKDDAPRENPKPERRAY
jgi:hypothetical protein